ncbi:MAG: hypothetical protein WCI04_07370 [archaeon]
MKKQIALFLAFLFLSVGINAQTIPTMPKRAEIKKATELVVVNDSLKEANDTLLKAKNEALDSLQKVKTELIKVAKPTTKTPIEWINYILYVLAVCLLWFLSTITKLQDSKYEIIQRLVAETSSRMKQVQIYSISLASGLFLLSQFYTFTNETYVEIINNLVVICSAISVFVFFTSKKAEHNA